jgi:hypothetical protein
MTPLIIDDFLPLPIQNLINELLIGRDFNWSVSKYSVSSTNLNEYFYTDKPVREHIQLRHGFAKDDKITSDYYTFIEPLKLVFESHMRTKVNFIHRIKSNFLISQKSPYIQPPHVDVMDMVDANGNCLDYKTLLYYVNESDGDTIFYNEFYTGEPVGLVTEQQRVSPKKGRAVIFDSNQIHSGSCPSVNDTRLVINCVFGI